ncbi:MAG: DUF2155 domain-containing protein [Alphaproteobacteria bacterium]|nr:DUF2155 domain-containing protein [Alphaproteobacteria bacterium]
MIKRLKTKLSTSFPEFFKKILGESIDCLRICHANSGNDVAFLCLSALVLLFLSPAHAREMTEYPVAKLQYLDKVTARTTTFQATIGETMNFGSLYVKVQSCQKSSPVDQPESAAFLQVWEGGEGRDSKWVFSGWMFASSPGLSSMDHPVYDVWVLDCLEDEAMKAAREAAEKAAQEEALEEETPPVE